MPKPITLTGIDFISINANIKLPDLAEECSCSTDAFTAIRWPEAIGLLQRLGVRLDRPYRRVVIDFDFDLSGNVTVLLDQPGCDAQAAHVDRD